MPSGVYDHKGKCNTKALTELQKAYSSELKGYKELAAAIRNRSHNINDISRAVFGMVQYIQECESKNEPAAIAGVILSSGLNRDAFYKARAGNYDHLQVKYMHDNNLELSQCPYDDNGIQYDPGNSEIALSLISTCIEKIYLYIESDLQRRSLTDKSMARTTGAIFNLKAVFNYNDKPEPETKTINNTLILNTNADQAAEAMRLLAHKDTK